MPQEVAPRPIVGMPVFQPLPGPSGPPWGLIFLGVFAVGFVLAQNNGRGRAGRRR